MPRPLKKAFWRSKIMAKSPEEMEKSMSGRANRDKGKRFEQEVAVKFREIYPHARRLLENHPEDAAGVDLLNTGPFKIQCKNLAGYAPIGRIGEVTADRTMGDIPVLVTKGHELEPMAVLPLSEFLGLVDMANRAHPGRYGGR